MEAEIDQYIHGKSDNKVNKGDTESEAYGDGDNNKEGLFELDEDKSVKDIEQDSTQKRVSAENKED